MTFAMSSNSFSTLFIKTNKLCIHKDIFACLFSIHNMISLSCHEQVGVYFWGLGFKKAWVALYYTTSNFILSNEI